MWEISGSSLHFIFLFVFTMMMRQLFLNSTFFLLVVLFLGLNSGNSLAHILVGKPSEGENGESLGENHYIEPSVATESVTDLESQFEIQTDNPNPKEQIKYSNRKSWISPSKLWNQLGFPTVPGLEDLLLIAKDDSPPQKRINIASYDLEAVDGIVYGSIACECGLPSIRIVGEGKIPARINDIPWTAAIVERDGWPQPFCGASLINDRFVLTAAHCINRRKPHELTIWLNDENLLLSNETLGGRLVYDVVEIIKHPQYRGYINDIALLKLNDTVKLGNGELALVNPVCIPINEDLTYADVNGIVAGWGRTSSGGETSPLLLKIEVPILDNKVCIEKSKYKDAIRETMMCAGVLESGGADACQGDSGGPLIVQKNTGSILVGIVSWGFGCAEPFSPGVYTRVSRYTEWILENTREAKWCQAKRV